MSSFAVRIAVIAAFVPVLMFAACRPVLLPAGVFAPAGDASPRFPVLAQAQSAPAAPAPRARAPVLSVAPGQPIGLPRVRDYEPIVELRDIYFDSGKAMIRPGDMKVLDANAAWLRAHPDHLVLIEGHSDNRGAPQRKNELNMDLGERRAQTAMNYLIARGIQPSRITILSYGEERPQCTEDSERCRSQNRRSRFLVKPR